MDDAGWCVTAVAMVLVAITDMPLLLKLIFIYLNDIANVVNVCC